MSKDELSAVQDKKSAPQNKTALFSRSPIFIAATVVFAIIIVTTLVFFIVNRYSFQPQGASDTMGVLRNISSQVSVADDTISSMNTYISQSVSNDNQSGVTEALQECPTALQALDDAYNIYNENKSFLEIQTDDELVSSLETSISKRKDLISNAKIMLNASFAVKNASSELDGLFSEVSSAATDMDNASTTIANNTSSTAAKQALEYDQSAEQHLQTAQESSQKIADKLKKTGDVEIQVDISALTSLASYLDKLLEAADFSIQADNALASGSSSEAQDLENKSTAALEQASALKSSITLDANEFAKSLYYSLSIDGVSTVNAEEQYSQAADALNAADKVVSAYMAARS